MNTRDGFVTEHKKDFLSRVGAYLMTYLPAERAERIKLVLLTLSFFFIIGAYTIAKELKDAMFDAIVGKDYIPYAKTITMFLLVPSIFIYSQLVDSLRKYQLLMVYTFAFGIIGLLFAVLLGNPTIGLPNTDASPYRIFGWLFYFFVEGYSPFVVSVFWAFANSVNSPENAKQNYAFIVSGSKIGGMTTAAFAYWLLSCSDAGSFWAFSDTMRHQLLFGAASVCLLVVPLVLWLLVRSVSAAALHGYEAGYQVERQRKKKGEESTGVLSGLSMLIKYPYAFGIFCVVLFYEVIQTIVNFQRIGIAKEGAAKVSEVSAALFQPIFFIHMIGLLISLFGTTMLLRRLGEKRCLLLVPFSIAALYIFFRITGTKQAFWIFLVGMRGIHYAFSYPVRESLYIPTVKEIKFKSKSWIDAFGAKFAKASGSLFNLIEPASYLMAQSVLFGGIMGVWIVAAYLLGTRFEKAVARNEVIGADQD